MLAKLRTTELKQQRKRWFVLVLMPTGNKICFISGAFLIFKILTIPLSVF